MIEKKLQKLLENASDIRETDIKNNNNSYFSDCFYDLSNFITKKINSLFFKSRNAKIIVNHFDKILPFIVFSNTDILCNNFNLLIEQPNFKEKFISGLKKYPYENNIDDLVYVIWNSLRKVPDKFDIFLDNDIFKTLATLDLRWMFYVEILNYVNKEKQKNFLNILVENKVNIPYSMIKYKGNNKQIIYDNLPFVIQNAQNLYNLMSLVKENPVALSEVKEYIDNNEEKAINSIFCETSHLVKITDPTLKEIIKLLIIEVVKNENIKFSEITYNGGGFSRVLLIGDKVIKLGNRITKSFPNNPYIITPLLRKEFNIDGESCFVEITERVDTNIKPSCEELYQLYKNLRDLGLIWTDIKEINVGRLKKENVIHWNEELKPSEEVLGLNAKRGDIILKKGDLVILDADFIYDEKDPNINYSNKKSISSEFEQRYQREKREAKKEKTIERSNVNIFDQLNNYDTSEQNFNK